MFLRLKREDIFGLLWRMVWGRIAERRKEKVSCKEEVVRLGTVRSLNTRRKQNAETEAGRVEGSSNLSLWCKWASKHQEFVASGVMGISKPGLWAGHDYHLSI